MFKKSKLEISSSAQGGSRTHMSLRPPAPEADASANSATWAKSKTICFQGHFRKICDFPSRNAQGYTFKKLIYVTSKPFPSLYTILLLWQIFLMGLQ